MSIQIPKGEILWLTFFDASGVPVYIITSKYSRDYYYLYEILADGKTSKLGKSKNPLELEEKYRLHNRIT